MKRRGLEYTPPLSAEDAARHALAAYYLAVADSTPPIGYPADESWSSPGTFLDTFLHVFAVRVEAKAHPSAEVRDGQGAMLARWEAPPRGQRHYRDIDPAHWAEIEARDAVEHAGFAGGSAAASQFPAGAGRSPAAMAHGCAAFDLSGGTAPAPSPTCADAAHLASEPVPTLQNRSLGGDTS